MGRKRKIPDSSDANPHSLDAIPVNQDQSAEAARRQATGQSNTSGSAPIARPPGLATITTPEVPSTEIFSPSLRVTTGQSEEGRLIHKQDSIEDFGVARGLVQALRLPEDLKGISDMDTSTLVGCAFSHLIWSIHMIHELDKRAQAAEGQISTANSMAENMAKQLQQIIKAQAKAENAMAKLKGETETQLITAKAAQSKAEQKALGLEEDVARLQAENQSLSADIELMKATLEDMQTKKAEQLASEEEMTAAVVGLLMMTHDSARQLFDIKIDYFKRGYHDALRKVNYNKKGPIWMESDWPLDEGEILPLIVEELARLNEPVEEDELSPTGPPLSKSGLPLILSESSLPPSQSEVDLEASQNGEETLVSPEGPANDAETSI